MRISPARILVSLAILLAGCEKQPELPPELRESEQQTPKTNYTATLSGPERLILAGVALEVGEGADGPTVTITGRGAAGEALELAGNARRGGRATSEPADSIVKQRFEILGPGKTWLGPTTGIRSMLSFYQAETAVIHVDRVSGDTATGRIEGRFWRFDRRDPALRPPTPEQFTGSFTARMIR